MAAHHLPQRAVSDCCVFKYGQWRNFMTSERSAGNCDTSAIALLKPMKKLQVGATFPNVETAMRIYLTLPGANCESECSFLQIKAQ